MRICSREESNRIMQIPIHHLTFFSRIRIASVPNLPRKETLDLSMIADRVHPQTWSLFQALRTRMRQLKGVSMKVLYEKNSSEPTPAFFYEGRQGNGPGQASPSRTRRISDPSWNSSRQNTRSLPRRPVPNRERKDQSPSRYPRNKNT